MDHKVTTDYTRLLHNANVKVYVRARPCADGNDPPEDMFERKREAPKNIVIKDTERMQYGNHAFSFDNIYWTDTTQPTLYESTSKVLVDYALKGINSCCFAYGQTGSGKTFSIFGDPGEKAGLLPRSIEYLFDMIERSDGKTKEVTLVVSFLEIYCDRVRDLAREYLKKSGRPVSFQTSSSTDWFLRQRQMNRTESASSFGSNPAKGDDNDDYEKANFEIHEDAQGRVFVKDLAMATVTTREEVDALVQAGLKLRTTHETKMNAVSSRSHTVFTIHVFQQNLDTEEIVYGQLNMVDLAGSERLKKSESDGQRLKEALHINSSLSAVGKVVMSLDPESGYNYIPYRDSKLTRLLQNSIGGNSYTILIATIHPMKEHYEECLSTLQFANRCRSVQNQPRVNHINGSVADKDRRIRKLQEELAMLRRQLEGLRAEYNNRFLRVLNELGFDAEEITESGEIKFADGMVLKSVFSDTDDPGTNTGGLIRTGGLSPLARLHGHGQHHANHAHSNMQLSKKDRDQLRQKYANAKTNFSVVVTEAKKDKEESRKAINEMRRRITQLEDMLAQKSKEFEHALTAEKARHRSEIQQLLVTSAATSTRPFPHQQQQHQTSVKPPRPSSAAMQRGVGEDDQSEQRHRQRIAALEQAKSNEIALIRQQYEHAIKQKHDDVASVKEQLDRVRTTTTQAVENLRGDCAELYAYAARLQQALEQAQRGLIVPMPKNVLADQHKLRNVKALLATDTKRHMQFHLQQAGLHIPTTLEVTKSDCDPAIVETVLFARSQDDKDLRSTGSNTATSPTAGRPVQRPVSAPVKRSKPTTYPSMLRDKVREQPTQRQRCDCWHQQTCT